MQKSRLRWAKSANSEETCHEKEITYTLQHTAAHCSTLQHTATHCNTCIPCEYLAYFEQSRQTQREHALKKKLHIHCTSRQQTATHCNTMQHTATHCNTRIPCEYLAYVEQSRQIQKDHVVKKNWSQQPVGIAPFASLYVGCQKVLCILLHATVMCIVTPIYTFFCKRATTYRALFRKMTYKYEASYEYLYTYMHTRSDCTQ